MFSLFAYFGPEASLPLASGIMAILGFALMMGRSCLTFVGQRFRTVSRRFGLAETQSEPCRTLRTISGLVLVETSGEPAKALDLEPKARP
jgi:hypothetical protein